MTYYDFNIDFDYDFELDPSSFHLKQGLTSLSMIWQPYGLLKEYV